MIMSQEKEGATEIGEKIRQNHEDQPPKLFVVNGIVRKCAPRGKGFFAVVVVDLSAAPMLTQRGHLKRLEADEGEERGVAVRVTTP
jgi:hypothetical protein